MFGPGSELGGFRLERELGHGSTGTVYEATQVSLEDEEEQFTWGFRVGDLSVPDPIVYRRNNARGQWKSEEGTFSEFVFDMFEWAFNDEED